MPVTGSRLRDFSLYTLIGLCLSLGLVWFFEHGYRLDSQPFLRWGGLGLNTAILYGYVVKDSRVFWHAWGFWLATVSFLAIHLLVFIVVLQHVEHWSMLWFLIMYPVEMPTLAVVCDWAVRMTGAKPKYGTDARHKR